MAKIRAFKAVRPVEALVDKIAALPYDVYSSSEARNIVEENPFSFLKIDRAETQFSEDVDMYSRQVYEKAASTLKEMKRNGELIQDDTDCLYIYELTMDGRRQRGLVCLASIDDYINGIIRRHENTRAEKELDRINHIDICNAHTGPIFLAYRSDEEMKKTIREIVQTKPIYDFLSEDGIGHRVWKISESDKISIITACVGQMEHLYIADGHHRAASAVKVGLKRRAEHLDYDGTEEFNYFLSVLFDESELKIFDYNRVVHQIDAQTMEHLLEKVKENFEIVKCEETILKPQKKGEIGMYFKQKWYLLKARPEIESSDMVDNLDVSLLQNYVLNPIFGIKDPKTDPNIQFVGGIRGLKELERIVKGDGMAVAFAMYPTSMKELLAVADEGRLMPPKSTWFEPKLRSGLFIHEF